MSSNYEKCGCLLSWKIIDTSTIVCTNYPTERTVEIKHVRTNEKQWEVYKLFIDGKGECVGSIEGCMNVAGEKAQEFQYALWELEGMFD